MSTFAADANPDAMQLQALRGAMSVSNTAPTVPIRQLSCAYHTFMDTVVLIVKLMTGKQHA